MKIHFQTFTVNKRFPLTISRGTTAQTTNIWVKIEEDGIEGWGEATPFSIVQGEGKNTDKLLLELQQIIPTLEKYSPLARQKIEDILRKSNVSSAVQAAIDIALYDWLGKRAKFPLWWLWGLDRRRIVPISVTIGINSPEGAQQRVQDWQALMGATVLKIKLGNPNGIKSDQAMVLAVREVAPEAQCIVNANGGWSLKDAVIMSDWLANQGVKYIEQPLRVGEESKLKILYQQSPLPIFVDESCFTSADIPRLAPHIDGINIKVMKAGGLTEALRMINIAKACNLRIMFGCYSDSILANTAMSHLAPLADYLDLDSHLNLKDDPFTGAVLQEGHLVPNDLPGLGVKYNPKPSFQ